MKVVPVPLTAVVSDGGAWSRESGPFTASWQENVNNIINNETINPGRDSITDLLLNWV
jgi:hypothetical protein